MIMNGVIAMGQSEMEEPLPPGEEAITEPQASPPKIMKVESVKWETKTPFPAPVYDVTQIGEVKFGPGARSALLGILGGSLPRLSSDQHETVTRAKKYAMEQSIKMVLMKQTLAHQQQMFFKQQMASQRTQVQRQQALALMCRVYVGSISFELKEDTIRAAFLPFGPIKSINMSWDPVTQKHKGFAFVEYEIPEGAQLALEQMNGAMLGGRNIKVVGRPSNMPQAQQVIDEIQEEAKNYNRIYIASIHQDLTEEDIRSVFEAFGPILCSKLSNTSNNTHKGYGFIEYATKQAAEESISSMNLFDLGGQLLRVGKSITPPNALMAPTTNSAMPTAAAIAAAAATAKIQAMDAVASNAVLGLAAVIPSLSTTSNPSSPDIFTAIPVPTSLPPVIEPPRLHSPTMLAPVVLAPITPVAVIAPMVVSAPVLPPLPTKPNPEDIFKKAQEKQQEELQKKLLEDGEPQTLQQQETMSIKGQSARHLVMQRLMRPVDSKVVILRNMVGPEDVDESLQEEIQDECSKFGTVERVVIYKEKQTDNEEDDQSDVLVKIFVEFSQSVATERSRDALNGRYFGGRLVKAEIYDQALFDHGDLSA